MEQVISFAGIREHHWESMVEQARQDGYWRAKFRALVWMRLRGLRS